MFNKSKLVMLNKADLEKELHSMAATYPALKKITTELTKNEMLAQAEEIITASPSPAQTENATEPQETSQEAPATNELDDNAKVEAMKDLISSKAEAVLFPSEQSFYRLKFGDNTFTIGPSPFSESPMTEVPPSKLRREMRAPDHDTTKRRFTPEIKGTALSSLPKWAYLEAFDLIQDGQLLLFETEAELQSTVGAMYETSKVGSLIVDDAVKPEIQVTKDRTMSLNEAAAPVILKPTIKHTRPEQEAAWRVVNEVVNGESPLPASRDDQDPDPKRITTSEIQHVRSRIERCMQHPESFTKETKVNGPFSLQVFFNQLLELEYSGFTPPRPGVEAKTGGTRPDIIRIIRELARQNGFEVLGDYVVKASASHELESRASHSLVPSVNL